MGSTSLSIYFREVSRYRLLSNEETLELILKSKYGDKAAEETLIKHNLRFVITIAKKFTVPTIELEDLIQEGNCGLMKSIERFDPLRKIKFLSYAVFWIRQSIYSFLNNNSRLIRLPANVIAEMDADEFAGDALLLLDDCQESSEMPLVEKIKNLSVPPIDRSLIVESLNYDMSKLFSGLSDREALVLKMYFGIGYERSHTLEEIGSSVKLSRERIRQIKEAAIGEIKKNEEFKNLIEYIE